MWWCCACAHIRSVRQESGCRRTVSLLTLACLGYILPWAEVSGILLCSSNWAFAEGDGANTTSSCVERDPVCTRSSDSTQRRCAWFSGALYRHGTCAVRFGLNYNRRAQLLTNERECRWVCGGSTDACLFLMDVFCSSSAQSTWTSAWTRWRIKLLLLAEDYFVLASCHARVFWDPFLPFRRSRKPGMLIVVDYNNLVVSV